MTVRIAQILSLLVVSSMDMTEHFTQFEDIARAGRDTPKIRETPRRLERSRYARKIPSLDSCPYRTIGPNTLLMPQSL